MQPINKYCCFFENTRISGLFVKASGCSAKLSLPTLLFLLVISSCTQQPKESDFPLVVEKNATPIYIDKNDFPGVLRAGKDFQSDIELVTDTKPELITSSPESGNVIIAGTIGQSNLIDALIEQKKISIDDISGKWENFLIEIIDNPFPEVKKALVIAGSDKRGTIYGLYEISKRIGVSPWYWWADVPVKKQQELKIETTRFVDGPEVQYRGIFINDEAPALSGWATEKFGGFNHQFYSKVYELILRSRGNFLWPAMWGRSIYDDDSLSAPLADEYGVVIGTSHHEPMMRAHVEWDRYGEGEWNYEKNESFLKEFWKTGIERMGNNESIITLAMRGDGDMAMSKDTNVELLQRIVKDQREILNEFNKPVESFPQVWALYKEVQDYYDEGMRVPEDITLLLCDDNWGNIRKLPSLNDDPRSGGYGIYYHFDYVGGPRNYKWLNTTQISRVWEQMNLAYQYGVEKIWIVNVGDIKPMELPISFFLDMAWEPNKWNPENLPEFTTQWAAAQFGNEHATKIASMLTRYTNYNARRKPELLSPETYSITHYREAERVVADYTQLATEAAELYASLAPEYKDAFYQLVLFPIQACANLNELYYSTALNRLYAKQGRSATNELAEQVRALFKKDQELTTFYNEKLAGGKWSHMMDQTHIGYTYWQQPPVNSMPGVSEIPIPAQGAMGVAIEGSTNWWPQEKSKAILPEFDYFTRQQHYIEIFNRGQDAFEYNIKTGQPWVRLSAEKGTIEQQTRIEVLITWEEVPVGKNIVPITITSNKQEVVVNAIITNYADQNPEGFIESNGYVSIEAEHFATAVNSDQVQWKVIPDIGKTRSGVSPFPVTVPRQELSGQCPRLEYEIFLFQPGEITIDAYLSPTLNFHNEGRQFAISVDDQKPQIINMHEDYSAKKWSQWVADNINIQSTNHTINTAGKHIIKFWMIDPGIVLQKIVVGTNTYEQCYMGPPESIAIKPTLSN